jgi:outer membrane protein assembly factor BamE (lipoprotein component of BamABCDE complex)
MTMRTRKKTGAAFAATALAVFMLVACESGKQLTTKQVQAVAGMGEDEVRARLGGPHYLTNAGDSVWWNYDGVADASGAPVSCHVIFKAGRVDKVEC